MARETDESGEKNELFTQDWQNKIALFKNRANTLNDSYTCSFDTSLYQRESWKGNPFRNPY